MSTTEAYTLERWIKQYRSQLNVVSDFVHKMVLSDGESIAFFSDETVLSKYHNELSAYLTTVDLTQREQEFYAYNPRLFSYDMYGEPEFWYLVLYANEMHSAGEFHVKRIKIYKPTVMKLLNSIRILETPRKDANEQEMTDVIVHGTVVNADINVDII